MTVIHSKLITAAARQILQPMGLVQKGRSRTWLDDHGWWLCVVEFQSSDWARGSYLNVGCNWLWQVKAHLSFDEGYRVEEFREFQDEQQFGPIAERLARRAATEVERYRDMFPTISAMAEHYSRNSPQGFWPKFDAAIACGVAGRKDEAQRLFRDVLQPTDDKRAWVLAAQSDAEQLDRMAADVARFRQIIADRVQQTRALQKLPIVSLEWG